MAPPTAKVTNEIGNNLRLTTVATQLSVPIIDTPATSLIRPMRLQDALPFSQLRADRAANRRVESLRPHRRESKKPPPVPAANTLVFAAGTDYIYESVVSWQPPFGRPRYDFDVPL